MALEPFDLEWIGTILLAVGIALLTYLVIKRMRFDKETISARLTIDDVHIVS
jgi:hypothetical protein